MAEIPIGIKQALDNYLANLAHYYHLNHIILFGSWAKGTPHQDSDIDLAIFSSDATDENRLEIMADCLLKSMPYKLDIQPLVYPLADYTSDNDFIQEEIIARGIEIPTPVAET